MPELRSPTVFLDTATLHDLDVLSTSTPGGPTVWALVDRTRTRIGRQVLRRHLIASPHSVEEIVARQRAHQRLAAEIDAYRAVVDRAEANATEDYLNSAWQLPSDMTGLIPVVGRVWPRQWYRDYLRDVSKGQACVTTFLSAAAELGAKLSASDASVLQDVGKKMSVLTSTTEAHELRRLGTDRSVRVQQAFDQLARGRAPELLTGVLECIGIVEAMWSMAVATVEHGWSYPCPGSQLRVKGLVHPFLGQQAVPNDLHLADDVRLCFVTGPNMAGKSTFLKAVAVAMLLAHAGCGVPAASMEFPTTGTIFSSVNIADNLSAGESFYLAEVRRIRALAQALREHRSAVAVVDEPFRGTNVHDAAEATLAVITRLAAHPTALVFIASHIGEIVPAIADDPRICLLHFAADVTADRPRFDFRLRDGLSTQRLGMTLLKQEQVLDLLGPSDDSS